MPDMAKRPPKMPVFLVGKDYWKGFDKIIGKMMSMRLINMRDTRIFTITDKVEDIVKAADKIGHPKVSENFYDGFREANFMKK
jgi:predicted Rossmann-fold nucleotide-binding protein